MDKIMLKTQTTKWIPRNFLHLKNWVNYWQRKTLRRSKMLLLIVFSSSVVSKAKDEQKKANKSFKSTELGIKEYKLFSNIE